MVLIASLSAGLPAPALAYTKGVAVKLVAGSEQLQPPIMVQFVDPNGMLVSVELLDSGELPDIKAGDGTWTAPVFVEGDEYRVSVAMGDRVLVAGTVSWDPLQTERDLLLALKNGRLDMTTSDPSRAAFDEENSTEGTATGSGVSLLERRRSIETFEANQPTEPTPGGVASATTADGAVEFTPFPGQWVEAPPGATGDLTDGSDGMTTPVGPYPRRSGGDPWKWVLGFAGLVGACILVVWGSRRMRSTTTGVGARVQLVPEAPLAGIGTPSLSDGLSYWVTSDRELDGVVEPLLTTLARHHRVLFVGPTDAPPPPVHGGPVYRMTNTRAVRVAAAVDAMQRQPGPRVTVFINARDVDADALWEIGELLPEGVGGVVVLDDPESARFPRVDLHRDGNDWVARVRDRTLRLRANSLGLEAVSSVETVREVASR